MTDLNSLALFAKVIEAGSFSEAARRLKMPISTVSRRIAELEDQLGVRLLERSTRNLRLKSCCASPDSRSARCQRPPFRRGPVLERYKEGLRKAGLPE